MKILLAGANGYIGTRLIPVLLEHGYDVVCLVRDKRRFHDQSDYSEHVTLIKGDLLLPESIEPFPVDIDAAFYLVHSMAQNKDFADLEASSAANFVSSLNNTHCRQIVYLSGITNDDNLSEHLKSRRHVEDVLSYLQSVLLNENAFNRTFDIGGPDVLSFKQLMLTYASVRGLNRYMVTLPFLSPKISSYWLYFVTSTSYSLAQSLVDSMKNETICRDNSIEEIDARVCLTYRQALEFAFEKIEQNSIVSSWKDALNRGYLEPGFMDKIKVPQNGTLHYKVKMPFKRSIAEVLDNIWSIGGKRGWYYWNWIWNLRGFLDKVVGGVGSRRGRTSISHISAGDTIDFWRVLLADKNNKRLLLYAEMKLPGEAWLEFKIVDRFGETFLSQVATFRPRGLWGRLYWAAMFPFHIFIFTGMAKQITEFDGVMITPS
jgi:uncharacterized protein YbjT (DUF2867 family)